MADGARHPRRTQDADARICEVALAEPFDYAEWMVLVGDSYDGAWRVDHL